MPYGGWGECGEEGGGEEEEGGEGEGEEEGAADSFGHAGHDGACGGEVDACSSETRGSYICTELSYGRSERGEDCLRREMRGLHEVHMRWIDESIDPVCVTGSWSSQAFGRLFLRIDTLDVCTRICITRYSSGLGARS